ncbi:XRE family transcriptional regulator [Ruegeria marisrubri]|uniref:XRE family transcriptional regulator n=1 Tax=Ruegeria marisrubri TaxID=1685379 RepID=A0A117KH08_9RHOB|nr:helix-turn-helix domain-containing protein [Ruegeria marisrubri]KUJ85590.1 XRE family transcriptional regulator [Ruegeria marisrubri]
MDENTDWFGPDAATFGDRVAGAREAAGMTQSQLARRLGVKKATIVSWEDDLSEPRANKLSMMAGMLNVSIKWLLTGEGEGTDAPLDVGEEAADLKAIMAELRSLRGEMRASAERAARLEKRIRKMMEQQG